MAGKARKMYIHLRGWCFYSSRLLERQGFHLDGKRMNRSSFRSEYEACSKRFLPDLSDHLKTEAEDAENTFYQPQNVLSGDRP